MKITCIIPTRGDRPGFVEQARRQIARQSRIPDEVIVVENETGVTGNVRAGYEKVAHGLVQIWEDDDLYGRSYLETIEREWQPGFDLIGFEQTMYYHLFRNEWKIMTHPGRASLFQTAIRAGLDISWPDDSENFLDLKLWQMPGLRKRLIRGYGAVGIKHGIGKTGGSAHKEGFRYDYKDHNGSLLKLITQGDKFYEELVRF